MIWSAIVAVVDAAFSVNFAQVVGEAWTPVLADAEGAGRALGRAVGGLVCCGSIVAGVVYLIIRIFKGKPPPGSVRHARGAPAPQPPEQIDGPNASSAAPGAPAPAPPESAYGQQNPPAAPGAPAPPKNVFGPQRMPSAPDAPTPAPPASGIERGPSEEDGSTDASEE